MRRPLVIVLTLMLLAAGEDPHWIGLEARLKSHVEAMPESRVREALRRALGFVGLPYIWGADDAAADGGFDCVGLVYQSFHDAGLEFPLARWSTMNMTDAPRGEPVPKVWWTEYAPDFAREMQDCRAGPFKDGDVLVYHALKDGKVVDRTGHVVIAVDAARGYAVSAARSAVRVHALSDLRRYDGRQLTACWRAPSAAKAPLKRPPLTWTLGLAGGDGTRSKPYAAANPLAFEVEVRGAGVKVARLEVLGRVNAFIGAVRPEIRELPAAEADLRRFRVAHDFKKVDLPVDPGEHIRTPLRKVVLRFLDDAGFVLGEKAVYIRLSPYWH
jgi:hypothetical protein